MAAALNGSGGGTAALSAAVFPLLFFPFPFLPPAFFPLPLDLPPPLLLLFFFFTGYILREGETINMFSVYIVASLTMIAQTMTRHVKLP